MKSERLITADEASIIELENHLEPGSFSFGRPATEAELIYLDQVEAYPLLAFHALGPADKPALYVVTPDKRHSTEDFVEMNFNLLRFGRALGRNPAESEPFPLAVTSRVSSIDRSSLYTISIHPGSILGIFSGASREQLLRPTFIKIPTTEYEERSPGRCIQDLMVTTVIHAEYLSFQSYLGQENYFGPNLDKLMARCELPIKDRGVTGSWF